MQLCKIYIFKLTNQTNLITLDNDEILTHNNTIHTHSLINTYTQSLPIPSGYLHSKHSSRLFLLSQLKLASFDLQIYTFKIGLHKITLTKSHLHFCDH